jgi:hypothetical protein
MENYSLRRVGAVCAIVGALVTGVSNGMHPELVGPAGIVRNAATSSGWATVHWGRQYCGPYARDLIAAARKGM